MNLVTINIDSIRIGKPLPFSLRDEDGVLLARKGSVVGDRDDLEWLLGMRSNLFIDVEESDSQHRAYVGQLYELVREERPIGEIADSQFSTFEQARSLNSGDELPNWLDLQEQCRAMLRDRNSESFRQRLGVLQRQLHRHTVNNPDGTLFALIYLSSTELQYYSATHAMLVCVMCSRAAREVLNWPEELQTSLCNAALTMNIGMVQLQDRLAQQVAQPSAEQRRQIEQHALQSVVVLEQAGVTDQRWLEAVLDHHCKTPGPLAARSDGERIARLIQRADMFAARLAPRASRAPESPASAMQACYFDENRQTDEAGAALIKAVGIYSPGSFVRLASDEVAVVVKRGANATAPKVAVLINRSGMPTGELIVRDTSRREHRIVTGVAHRLVKVNIPLDRLLALTRTLAPEPAW